MKLKIATIIGTRPQFIKACVLSSHISSVYADQVSETIIHSGQHFSANMSDDFLKELSITAPIVRLSFNASRHGHMTAEMLSQFESYLIKNKPDYVLVYGDTNTTLAGALAAAKLMIPILHVEAGLRSYNKTMPEEINRVLTDHLSQLLFCPTKQAVTNLSKEGITEGVHIAGDVMYDLYIQNEHRFKLHQRLLKAYAIKPNNYILATCHRAENTNHIEKLKRIISALIQLSNNIDVVFPVHPRTQKVIEQHKLLETQHGIKIIPPLGYIDMLSLQKNAKLIITDSGGMQKEAFFAKTPCLTIRDETEWHETLLEGWNVLVNVENDNIMDEIYKQLDFDITQKQSQNFGDGSAADKIIKAIVNHAHAA